MECEICLIELDVENALYEEDGGCICKSCLFLKYGENYDEYII